MNKDNIFSFLLYCKFLLVFYALFFFSSCAGYQDLTGESLVIKTGDTASVKYTADAFHGYEWVVSSNSDRSIAKFIGITNIPGSNNNDNITQVFNFKGLKKGKTIVTLNYIKKNDIIAKKSRTLNITVF